MMPWPHFDEEQIEAVGRVLGSGKVNYWTGQEARAFEREFAEACDCRYGIALANGTVALELALHALGIGEGDEVVVTPRTFVASAGCVSWRNINNDASFAATSFTERSRDQFGEN